MAGPYSLDLTDSTELGRFTVRSEKGLVYVYRQFAGRWEITKLKVEDVEEAARVGSSGDDVLASVPVTYRIFAGRCTCRGFTYRHECAHRSEVVARGFRL